MATSGRVSGALLCAAWLTACGAPEEPARVQLEVVADASGVEAVTTDLGYEVTLTEARAAVEDLAFAVAGEEHAGAPWKRLWDALVPNAYAHPGHFQKGTVTGELRGRFVLDWLPGKHRALGTATLLVGSYQSAELTFARAGKGEGVEEGDPLFGHTALLRGSATKGEQTFTFTAIIDSPEGRELVGIPFEHRVDEGSREVLGVRLLTRDPLEGHSLFDGIDFAALDGDGDGEVVIGPADAAEAYNLLRRAFQTHDHFDVRASQPGE